MVMTPTSGLRLSALIPELMPGTSELRHAVLDDAVLGDATQIITPKSLPPLHSSQPGGV